MKKLILFMFLTAVPLLIFAGSSCFGLPGSSFGQQALLQNDRAYRVMQRTDQAWTYATNV